MTKNMGKVDWIIRVLAAVLFLVLYFTRVVSGTLGIVLIVLALIFLITSLVSFCPLYKPFGIKTTCEKKS